LPEAIEDFSRAIRIDPHIYIYYKDRGKAYSWMSEFAYAELDYSKALEINDRISEMWFRRSLVRSSLNKFREGLEDALMAKNLGFEVDEEYIKGLTLQVLKADSVISK
jgi:tetratricopeptide (TPR) repeat protein